MKITLLVTGSIAAYKSAEIVRELKKLGHSVRVGMSDGAKEFITPLTLQTLSGEKVASKLFDLEEESQIGHIDLADSADLILIAPATANFLAKAAAGIADDLPSTVILAARGRIVACPAMNVNMWHNPATQDNLAKLRLRGWDFVEPDSGELACGWIGKGRLAETNKIIARAIGKSATGELSGESVVVTAGPTREKLDPIRFISNSSTGKMGIEIARAALQRGATVQLLLGPGVQADLSDSALTVSRFDSALDLQKLLKQVLEEQALPTTLFMAAAPGDFRAEQISASKLKNPKTESISMRLVPNPDIVADIAQNRERYPRLQKIVGFAAESETGEKLIQLAEQKLKSKQVDLIVANSIEESFGLATTRLFLVGPEGLIGSSGAGVDKSAAAGWLIQAISEG